MKNSRDESLWEKINRSGLRKGFIADRTGIKPKRMSEIINNHKTPTSEEIQKIDAILAATANIKSPLDSGVDQKELQNGAAIDGILEVQVNKRRTRCRNV